MCICLSCAYWLLDYPIIHDSRWHAVLTPATATEFSALPRCLTAINVGENVDPYVCEYIDAGASCVPSCVDGYTPVSVSSFVCPATGGAVDLSGFECTQIPSGINVNIAWGPAPIAVLTVLYCA